MGLGSIKVELTGKTQRFEASFQRAGEKLTRFQKIMARVRLETGILGQHLSKAGARFSAFGAKVAKAAGPLGGLVGVAGLAGGALLAVATVVVKSIQAFSSFERVMNRVGGVTQSLGTGAFEQLKTSARELAETTKFSANDVGRAMVFLGQAGQTANQILAVTPAVLNLASASMLDVADAANIVTNIMAGMQIGVGRLSEVNDLLVGTSINANVSVQQLGAAFKFVGPVASSAGLKLDELSAAMGVLGNAGLQGELAGTGLRTSIVKLLSPTKEAQAIMKKLGVQFVDSSGRIDKLVTVVRKLEEAGASTGQIMEIFGQRGGLAIETLVSQGSDKLGKLTDKLGDVQGIAKKLADDDLKTLGGQFDLLKSTIAEFFTSVGAILGPFTKLWVASMRENLQAVTGFAKALSFLLNFDSSGPQAKLNEELETSARLANKLKNRLAELKERRDDLASGRTMFGNLADVERRIAGIQKRLESGFDSAAAKARALAKAAEKAAEAARVKREKRVAANAKRVAKEAAIEKSQAGVRKGIIALSLEADDLVIDQTAVGKASAAIEKLGIAFDKQSAALASEGFSEKEQRSLGRHLTSSFDAFAKQAIDSAENLDDFNEALQMAVDRGLVTEARAADISADFDDTKTPEFREQQKRLAEAAAAQKKLADAAKEAAETLKQVKQTETIGGRIERVGGGGALAQLAGSAADGLVGAVANLDVSGISSMAGSVIGGAVGSVFPGVGTVVGAQLGGAAVSAVENTLGALGDIVVGFGDFFDQRLGGALAAGIGPAAGALIGVSIVSAVFPILAPLQLLVAPIVGLVAVFGALFMQTKAFARLQEAFSRSFDRVIEALEPFGDMIGGLAPLFDKIVDAIIPLADAFANSKMLADLLFGTFRFGAEVFAVAAFVAGVMANALTQFAIAVEGDEEKKAKLREQLVDTTGIVDTFFEMGVAIGDAAKVRIREIGDGVVVSTRADSGASSAGRVRGSSSGRVSGGSRDRTGGRTRAGGGSGGDSGGGGGGGIRNAPEGFKVAKFRVDAIDAGGAAAVAQTAAERAAENFGNSVDTFGSAVDRLPQAIRDGLSLAGDPTTASTLNAPPVGSTFGIEGEISAPSAGGGSLVIENLSVNAANGAEFVDELENALEVKGFARLGALHGAQAQNVGR